MTLGGYGDNGGIIIRAIAPSSFLHILCCPDLTTDCYRSRACIYLLPPFPPAPPPPQTALALMSTSALSADRGRWRCASKVELYLRLKRRSQYRYK